MPSSVFAPTSNVYQLLETLISTGVPAATDAAAVQTFITNIGNVSTAIANKSNLPAPVAADIATFNSDVTALGSDVGLGNDAKFATDGAALLTSANALLISMLAAELATDVSSNGCSGYDVSNAGMFQQYAGITVTNVYDDATVTAIEGILGSSMTVPAACSGVTSPTSPSPPVPTPSPVISTTTPTATPTAATPPASVTTTVLAVSGGVLAVGTLAYFLWQTGQVAAALENPRRRRRGRR
jgi:hypothetical protein